MPEISVSEKILSEDYADLILPVTLSGSYFLNAYMQMGGELLGGNYGVIHVPLSSLPRDLLAYVGYYNIPKLYTRWMKAASRPPESSKSAPSPFSVTPEKTLSSAFSIRVSTIPSRFSAVDGRSRIVGLWDQTDQTGTPPENLSYGSAYTGEDLNRALTAEDPLSVVPSADENGHGTILASIASGSADVIPDFSGRGLRTRISPW